MDAKSGDQTMALGPQLALTFDGDCEAALRCYERCLNGTLTFLLRWGDSPAASEVPANWGTKIYHATLKVGAMVIFGSDQPPDRFHPPSGFDLIVPMRDPAVADRVFHELAEGGRVTMPLQETFWASRFGALVDRFGIPWTINCERAGDAAE